MAQLEGDPQFDITSLEELRELIGTPKETTALKTTKLLTETQVEFVRRSPFCVLASTDAHGVPAVSPKGDLPGFVKVVSPSLLLLPDRPGNKLICGLQNILQQPIVQVMFMIPNTCETLRVTGIASLSKDASLCNLCAAGGQDAILVIRIHVTECYYHCAKAFLRSQLWKPQTWPPDRFRVKIGSIIAKNAGEDEAFAKKIEDGYAASMNSVEAHYTENVWHIMKPKVNGLSAAHHVQCLTAAALLALGALTVLPRLKPSVHR